MINFKFLRFPFEVCVPHTVNELVTDMNPCITSQKHLMFTILHIGSRLFELFSKEVRVNKQPGRPLRIIVIMSKILLFAPSLVMRRCTVCYIETSLLRCIFGKAVSGLNEDRHGFSLKW